MNSSISRSSRSSHSSRASRSFHASRSTRSSHSPDSSFSDNAPTCLALYHFYHISAPTSLAILTFYHFCTNSDTGYIDQPTKQSIYQSIGQPRNKSMNQLAAPLIAISFYHFTICRYIALIGFTDLPFYHFYLFRISAIYRFAYFTILTPIPFCHIAPPYWFYHFLVFWNDTAITGYTNLSIYPSVSLPRNQPMRQ